MLGSTTYISKASLRFEKRLNFSINPWKLSIFSQTEVNPSHPPPLLRTFIYISTNCQIAKNIPSPNYDAITPLTISKRGPEFIGYWWLLKCQREDFRFVPPLPPKTTQKYLLFSPHTIGKIEDLLWVAAKDEVDACLSIVVASSLRRAKSWKRLGAAWGGGGVKLENLWNKKRPKQTLLADNTWGLITKKQTKPRPVASAAPHPITPTNKAQASRFCSTTSHHSNKQSPGQSLLQHRIPSLQWGGGVNSETVKWLSNIFSVRWGATQKAVYTEL